MRRWLTVITLLWVAVLVLVAAAGPSQPQSAQSPTQPKPVAPAAGYVGSDTCVLCHTAHEGNLKGTAHGQVANPRSPAAA